MMLGRLSKRAIRPAVFLVLKQAGDAGEVLGVVLGDEEEEVGEGDHLLEAGMEGFTFEPDVVEGGYFFDEFISSGAELG